MAALSQMLGPAAAGVGGADAVRASLALLAAAALQGNAYANAGFASPELPAADSTASFCGPALSVSAAVLPAVGASGDGWALPVGRAMPPCAGASTPGKAAVPVTLPPAIVALQPPPSVALDPALLAQLAAATPGASLAIVQWGVSPVPETAGTNVIAYRPLVKSGTLAAAADAAATAEEGANGTGRRTRALGLGSLFQSLTVFARGVFGGAPLRRDGATVAANAALRAAAPRPVVSYDRLASRPMDTRVVSISVAPRGGGAPLQLSGLAVPYTVTLPLRDLSVVRYSAATGSATIEVGTAAFSPRSLAVVCPASPGDAARGVAARYTAPPALSGRRAPVALLKVSTVAFFELSSSVEGAAGNVGLAGALVGDAGGGGSAGALPLPSPVPAPAGAFYYLLSTDCGAPFSNGTFLCGPGTEGRNVSFSCPAVVPTPACLWFDKGAGGWSAVGCVATNVTETAFTCACTAPLPADFAGRFAALDLPDNDLFVVEAPLLVVTPPPAPFITVVISTVVAVVGAWAAAAAKKREEANWGRYAERVAADGEVVWLTQMLGGGGPLPELEAWKRSGRVGGARSARQRPRVAPAPSALVAAAAPPPPPPPPLLPTAPPKHPSAAPLGALAAALLAPLQPCAPLRASAAGAAAAAVAVRRTPYHVPTPLALLQPLTWARCVRRNPLAAVAPRFDPLLPAPLRVFALSAAVVVSLFVAVGGAAALAVRGAPPAIAFFSVALLSGAALCAFFWAALKVLVAPQGARAWAYRFPVLAAELARRRDAGAGEGVGDDSDEEEEENGKGEDAAPPDAPGKEEEEEGMLAEGWTRVVAAAEEARSPSRPPPPSSWQPPALLATVFIFFAYAAYAGEVVRGPSATRGAAGAWALGVALAGCVLAPLGEGAWVALHLLLLPAAAPLLPRRLRAVVRGPAGVLSAGQAVAGRLAALLLGGVGAAAAAGSRGSSGGGAAAEEVAAAAPLRRVAALVQGVGASSAAAGVTLAARLAAVAEGWRARALSDAAAAALASAVIPAAAAPLPVAVKPPQPPPLPPPAPAPPAPADALDDAVAASGPFAAREVSRMLAIPPLGAVLGGAWAAPRRATLAQAAARGSLSAQPTGRAEVGPYK